MKQENWMKDRVEAVVMNMESPGHHIDVGINGYNFKMHHGVKVLIPRAVVNVLNDAVKTVYKIDGDLDKGMTRVATKEPRYMCTITNDKPSIKASAKEETKKAVASGIFNKKKAEIEEDVE